MNRYILQCITLRTNRIFSTNNVYYWMRLIQIKYAAMRISISRIPLRNACAMQNNLTLLNELFYQIMSAVWLWALNWNVCLFWLKFILLGCTGNAIIYLSVSGIHFIQNNCAFVESNVDQTVKCFEFHVLSMFGWMI